MADLRQALEDRKLIERARNMIMRYVCKEEKDAYRRLRKLASDGNRKLVEIARPILAAGEVFQQIERVTLNGTGGDGRQCSFPLLYSTEHARTAAASTKPLSRPA